MIGSIIGVGLANQLMAPAGSATSGVDWSQAMGVFRALLFSPVFALPPSWQGVSQGVSRPSPLAPALRKMQSQ